MFPFCCYYLDMSSVCLGMGSTRTSSRRDPRAMVANVNQWLRGTKGPMEALLPTLGTLWIPHQRVWLNPESSVMLVRK